MAKLTKRVIDALQKTEKELFLWDDTLPGFGVRMRKAGSKSFVVQYRNQQGRTRRITLGPYGRLTLDEARKQARNLLAQVDQGLDPAEARDKNRTAPKVADLAARYLSEHAEVKKKASSVRSDRSNLRLYVLPTLGNMRVDAVSTKDVARLHHSLKDRPIQGNRVLALISKMFSLAESWGLRPQGSNPCMHIQKYREKQRKRYLTTEELARLGAALRQVETDGSEMLSVITAIRLLIFTGCRREEILTLKWDYVDFELGCLRLPDSKTGAKLVPLGGPALEILGTIPKQSGNPFVCPGVKPMSHLVGLPKAWNRIKQKANIKDLTLHDLRHGFASVGAGQGMSLTVIGGLLGHTQAATTMRYAHLSQDPLKVAAEAIANELASAMDQPIKEKVVALAGRKRK